MVLTADIRWRLQGEEVDSRMLDLLRAIARRGSLNQAIREVGLSYRHAWGLLGRIENSIGQPLVALERGRGARLTPLGEFLIGATADCDREIGPRLHRWTADFNRLVRRATPQSQPIAIKASHDLALGKLRDMLLEDGHCDLDLQFLGSLDALHALARHQCDFAGFHIPESPLRPLMLEPFRALLKASTLRVVHFADRQQGLMIARGNPLGIRDVTDLGRRDVRFVNRQPGSGTRLFLDQMLTAHGIRPAQVTGYRIEEFTHAAVAATVASGMADCAFGIEAAARLQGLDFVPLASESYYLAARRATLARPGPRALLEALGGAAFRRLLQTLPGYAMPAQSEPFSPHALFAG